MKLWEAAAQGRLRQVRWLIDSGADVNGEPHVATKPIMAAAMYGEETIARLLLDSGADVNIKTPDGTTALMEAAKKGKEAMVECLLDRGADINAATKWGGTALSRAVEGGHVDIVASLVERGANVNTSEYGKTLLELAQERANPKNGAEILEIIQAACNDPTQLPESPGGVVSQAEQQGQPQQSAEGRGPAAAHG